MRRFLTGTILFSSVSPSYEANLLNEIFDCNKYLKIPIDTLWKMRVRDRRFIISRHNKDAREEMTNSNSGSSTTDIDRFTDLTLKNNVNRK